MEITTPYAAGFFDGEGCVRVASSGNGSLCVRCQIMGVFQPGLLEQFQSRWGGSIHIRKRPPPRRNAIEWTICTKQAQVFMRDILPHLIEKREQVEVALQVSGRRARLARDKSLSNRLRALKRKNPHESAA